MNVREGDVLGPGIAEELLGERTWRHPLLQRFRSLSPDLRQILLSLLVGALVFVPYVGAVGLWDPWETHYGEVAREMMSRNDYVHPYWESSWFYSKPPLTMWMDVVGMALAGTDRAPPGKLPLYTEWAMRMPFVLAVMGSLALLALALGRVINRRVGLASTFVLSTMSLFFLITRQAVTDTPFVATLIAAMACALIGLFDTETRHRTGWWMAFYVFCGLSMLAKGLLGVGLPAVILLAYALLAVVPWTREGLTQHWEYLAHRRVRRAVVEGRAPMPALFAEMSRMRLLTGIGVFFAVAGPWYAVMCTFPEVDNEGKTFFVRFFIHDHFERLLSGVHTTTPGGSFTYFIEQGGYALFPWVAALPGALALAARLRLGTRMDTRSRVTLIALIWAVFAFLLVGESATKFHHYVLPVLPGMAVLIALFIDQLWDDGPAAHGVTLILGLVLFALVARDLASTPKDFTDLFVYNYERTYPHDLDTRPIVYAWSRRPLMTGDVLALVLLALGAWLAFGATAKDRASRVQAQVPGLLVCAVGVMALVTTSQSWITSPLRLLAVAVLAIAGYWLWGASTAPPERRRAMLEGAAALGVVGAVLVALPSLVRLDPLWTNLRQPMNVKQVLGWTFALGGVATAVSVAVRSRGALFGVFGGLALGFALWFSWSHWVDLSHHWTQRDLFWRYYDRRKPGEPIVAYMMDWKGETFYSRNTVKQIKDSPQRMAAFANLPGRKWALVEHPRLGLLRQAVGPEHRVEPVDRDLNVKFVLVTID